MHSPIDRRTFIQSSAALAAAPLLAAAEPKENAVFPIIDTHQHLWDLKKFKLPWLKDNATLARSVVMEDYLKATGELAKGTDKLTPAKVVKAVYMEVDVAPEQQQAEADFLIALCKAG